MVGQIVLEFWVACSKVTRNMCSIGCWHPPLTRTHRRFNLPIAKFCEEFQALISCLIGSGGTEFLLPTLHGLYRYVVPPIPGAGGSDLFPGPGAGVYPTRFVIFLCFPLSCWMALASWCVLIFVHANLVFTPSLFCHCRGEPGGGSMLIGVWLVLS